MNQISAFGVKLQGKGYKHVLTKFYVAFGVSYKFQSEALYLKELQRECHKTVFSNVDIGVVPIYKEFY